MIEQNFDVPFVASLARKEKQIQQNYRPIIAVHKWFARRPGTLFRSLILSEFQNEPLQDVFFKSNKLEKIRIADPFMGGGIPLIEANRLGCNIIGFDINPMAFWIVREELDTLDLKIYKQATEEFCNKLEAEVGPFYTTKCTKCGSDSAAVKYFLWVKQHTCENCKTEYDLFPGYLLAENKRHPKNVIICANCGELSEVDDLSKIGDCNHCGNQLLIQGPATRSYCTCPNCGDNNHYPNITHGAPNHRLFAIEYYCPDCYNGNKGRFFKKPDQDDLAKMEHSKDVFQQINPQFIPKDKIPTGDETNRLHRWGYKYYSDMFNQRQLLGLEISCRLIHKEQNQKIRNALATNLSDLLRYQNMLCRFDTMALKSLDIFSLHGYPVGLIQCESNLLGIRDSRHKSLIGSGGWSNIIEKFIKAKSYCDSPFEITTSGEKKRVIFTTGEWIGDKNSKYPKEIRTISIKSADSAQEKIAPNSLDAILTDPPYFGNVQYAELMDFCYIWLRKLVGNDYPEFEKHSTRHPNELTVNDDMGRGINHFTEGLSNTFQNMVQGLKSEGALIFTYHHNSIEAYLPVAISVLDSGFICTAVFPCPAEMGASIHIKGTESSTVDTIFVCRQYKQQKYDETKGIPKNIADFVQRDIENLKESGYKATQGDIRCMICGHIIHGAIWNLRKEWNKSSNIERKLSTIRKWIEHFGGVQSIEKYLEAPSESNAEKKKSKARL